MSSTRSVIATANTPSLNASRRLVLIPPCSAGGPGDLPVSPPTIRRSSATAWRSRDGVFALPLPGTLEE